ncbi:MAG: NFACT RNA binding domain-containing protein [Candidatus Ornithospirochaeta sp.]|nr:NFACT RNA binding domain-containing protein [Candidatus Ornithospirochaeta sp.]
MGLNFRELGLILSELPLENSYIQKVTEHSVHSLTLSLFNDREKAWLFYIEIATPYSRVCRTDRIRKKSSKAQRFSQYLRSHVIGRRISGVRQYPYDRAFELELTGSTDTIRMVIRLFSGPGANIFILDSEGMILEALFRRPKREETAGFMLRSEIRDGKGSEKYAVREFEGPSFNSYIDRVFSEEALDDEKDDLTDRIREKRDSEIAELEALLSRQMRKAEEAGCYGLSLKHADLLSGSIYLVRKGQDSVTLDDWETGERIVLPLDPSLSPNENLEKLYSRYRKEKRTYELAVSEIEDTKRRIEERKRHYEQLLGEDSSLQSMRKEARDERPGSKKDQTKPGLWVRSNGFDIAIGRNARENDILLRSYTRGSDIWMHTRDYSGGYVIIKAIKDKTVPLPVLLDAASLAIHYSKAKKEGKADLYYTYVKYLRRAKNGKTGLVIPTQEKNLRAEMDEKRVKELLGREYAPLG